MKKLFTVLLSFIFISLTCVSTVKALSPVRPTIKEQRKEIIQKRCEKRSQLIDTRITKFNTNKEKHLNNYNLIKQKLLNLITKLQKKGYDVSKLQADAKTWDEKVKKYAADYTTFIAKLTETKNYACGESQGNFGLALNQARQQLLIVKQDAVDMRNFHLTVIRPDMQALRTQKPTQTP